MISQCCTDPAWRAATSSEAGLAALADEHFELRRLGGALTNLIYRVSGRDERGEALPELLLRIYGSGPC